MDLLLWIAVALGGICVVLLAVLLWQGAQIRRTNTDPSEKLAVLADRLSQIGASVSAEFERSRREQSLFQEQQRRETREELDAMAKQIERLRADNFEQMQRMQESNEKKLDEMRKTVDEKLTETLGTRLDASFKTVSHQLESVYKSLGEMKELSTGVTDNVTALNRVLTNVKARGTWAEVQLRSVLDQTIPGMFVENYAPDPLAKDRVEFAVRIPSTQGSEAYLPIDSKFPMEDYVRFCHFVESGDAQAAAAARKALETVVLHEARTVAKYIRVPQTTPFAILYLATEGLYAEILSSRSGIAERVQRECGVLLAGPSTITALLNSLALGFRAVAVNEKANEVRMLLAAARQQYDKFGDVLQKARKKIDEAGRSLDEAQDRNRIIAGKLKNVETIGDEQAEALLNS
jgi:DNA recombination protein RmuC